LYLVFILKSGLRLAAFTALPVEALCVAEAGGVGKREETVGKSESATVG